MTTNPHWDEPHPGGPMSEEEYLRLDANAINARYEYLDGVAQMMSGGSGEHDQIAHNVYRDLDLNFRSGPCFVRGENMKVLVGTKAGGKDNYLYPDVTVSCNVDDRRRGNKIIRRPHIVVEVLSPSNEKKDRNEKFRAYQACPFVQEIVLINQFAPYVEVWRRNEENENKWHYSHYGPGEAVLLESLDISISMDDIYRGIDFDEPLIEE